MGNFSALNSNKETSDTDLLNYMYDWELENIPLLKDDGTSVAFSYGVSVTPTTIVLDNEENVLHRWEKVALSQELALNLFPPEKTSRKESQSRVERRVE